TTTYITEAELSAFHLAVQLSNLHSSQQLSALLGEHGLVFLYDHIWGGRVVGIPSKEISYLTDNINSDVILIEADSAQKLSLKAPYPNQPTIPTDATLVVPVAGLDVVGQPFNKQSVYNPERIIEQYGFPLEQPIQH